MTDKDRAGRQRRTKIELEGNDRQRWSRKTMTDKDGAGRQRQTKTELEDKNGHRLR